MTDAEMEDGYRLSSLNNALDILEEVGHQEECGVTELSRSLTLSKSAVHKILWNLAVRGYVEQCDNSRYRLGLRVWELGARVPGHRVLVEAAHESLLSLVHETGESAQLAVYDDGEVIYLDKVETDHNVKAYTEIGGRNPAHSSATGKVLLAHCRADEVDRLVRRGMTPSTDRTICDPEELARALASVRQQGYATNHGELRVDVNGVAAPVHGRTGEVVAALSVSGPAYRFGALEMEKAVVLLRRAAQATSQELGFHVDDG